MSCDKLFKEAVDDNIKGIDFSYKSDEVLGKRGNQKFSATQLKVYLEEQGVSPYEIKSRGLSDYAKKEKTNAD